jgi:hypothetical protein
MTTMIIHIRSYVEDRLAEDDREELGVLELAERAQHREDRHGVRGRDQRPPLERLDRVTPKVDGSPRDVPVRVDLEG